MRPDEALKLHRDRIRDELAAMVEAIERIQRYTDGMTLDDFLADPKPVTPCCAMWASSAGWPSGSNATRRMIWHGIPMCPWPP